MDFNDDFLTQPQDDSFDLDTPQEPPKKKKKTGLLIGIVAAVAALALVVGLLFAFGVFGGKADPETLHQAMVSQAKEGLYSLTDPLASGIHSAPTTYLDQELYGAQCDIHMLLSETFLEELGAMLSSAGSEIPLSWLQDISLRYDMSSTQTQTRYLMDIGLGDAPIATIDMILDLETNAMYMGLPGFSDYYMKQSYLSVEGMEDMDLSGMTQKMMELAEEFWTSLPAENALKPCLRSYADLLLSKLQDPQVGTQTVTVSGKSQGLTTVTYKITTAELCDLGIAILEKAKTDETLKQFIVAFSSYGNSIMENTDPEHETVDLYQELLSTIEEGLAQLEEEKKSCNDGDYLELIGYMDKKQVLQGMKLTGYSTDEEPFTIFYWVEVADGETELMLARLGEGDELLLAVSGTQSEKNGVYNGAFELDFGDKEELTLELKDFKDGAGSIQLTPNITLLKELLGDSYSSLRMLFGSKLGLRLDLEKNGDGFHLTSEGESVIGLTVGSLTMGPGEEIVLPEDSKVLDSEDPEASMKWMETLDPSKLLENLEKAGVPKELLEGMGISPDAAA